MCFIQHLLFNSCSFIVVVHCFTLCACILLQVWGTTIIHLASLNLRHFTSTGNALYALIFQIPLCFLKSSGVTTGGFTLTVTQTTQNGLNVPYVCDHSISVAQGFYTGKLKGILSLFAYTADRDRDGLQSQFKYTSKPLLHSDRATYCFTYNLLCIHFAFFRCKCVIGMPPPPTYHRRRAYQRRTSPPRPRTMGSAHKGQPINSWSEENMAKAMILYR